MEISESLKRFRQEFKVNQREVAAALKIPYQSYQGYEYGRNIPSAKIIVNLANIYKVSADYLLGLTDNPHGMTADNAETKPSEMTFEERLARLEKIVGN